jgi:hypothetical protein
MTIIDSSVDFFGQPRMYEKHFASGFKFLTFSKYSTARRSRLAGMNNRATSRSATPKNVAASHPAFYNNLQLLSPEELVRGLRGIHGFCGTPLRKKPWGILNHPRNPPLSVKSAYNLSNRSTISE